VGATLSLRRFDRCLSRSLIKSTPTPKFIAHLPATVYVEIDATDRDEALEVARALQSRYTNDSHRMDTLLFPQGRLRSRVNNESTTFELHGESESQHPPEIVPIDS
jgi:hypothetical protein